jgi:DNA-binding beta-propeller fold protein YncE
VNDRRSQAFPLVLIAAALAVPAALAVVVVLVLMRAREPAPSVEPAATVTTPADVAPPRAAASVESAAPSSSAPAAPAARASAAPEEPDTLGDVALEFGQKGDADGQLDDARAIAAAPNGDVYVAEYGSGRIQRFDAAGKFVSGFRVSGGAHGTFVPSIAATSDGFLWVSCGGQLLKLALPEGKIVKTVASHEPTLAYDGMGLDPQDNVYAVNQGATTWTSTDGKGPPKSDELRKLDKRGALLGAWKGLRDNSYALTDRVAADADGNSYLLERGGRLNVVDAKGKLKTWFKTPGGEGIAIDGKGRILLANRGVLVLDAAGAKLGQMGRGRVEAVAVGRDGRVVALVDRTRVQVITPR